MTLSRRKRPEYFQPRYRAGSSVNCSVNHLEMKYQNSNNKTLQQICSATATNLCTNTHCFQMMKINVLWSTDLSYSSTTWSECSLPFLHTLFPEQVYFSFFFLLHLSLHWSLLPLQHSDDYQELLFTFMKGCRICSSIYSLDNMSNSSAAFMVPPLSLFPLSPSVYLVPSHPQTLLVCQSLFQLSASWFPQLCSNL